METSEQIIEVIGRLLAGGTPNFFSSKLYKKAAKHPKLSELKEITNEILVVANSFNIKPEDKIIRLKKLSGHLKQTWLIQNI
jgi:glucose-6-phosphate dehydrogenase assembly protein OpcA